MKSGIAILCLMAAALLAGCGSKPEPEKAAPQATPPAEVSPVPSVPETAYRAETSFQGTPVPLATPTPFPFRGETSYNPAPQTVKVQGYLTQPTEGKPLGGVLIVHDWWGNTHSCKVCANSFAQRGYAALALDLYDGVLPTDRGEAARMMRKLTPEEAVARLREGVKWLASLSSGDGYKVGVVGFGWGGELGLRLAAADPDVKALAIFDGQCLLTPVQIAAIKCPLLAFYSSRDALNPPARRQAFDRALTEAGVPHELVEVSAAPGFILRPAGTGEQNMAQEARKRLEDFLDKQLTGKDAAK